MDITLTQVEDQGQLKEFVTFPWVINRGDPYWVPPLISERMKRLDIQRNPFWKEAERQLWIARRAGKPVGTIAAILDRRGNRILNESAGGFGFFDCVNDGSVADFMLRAAAEWLKVRGMTVMRGPYNPTQTEDYGILVEGYETMPSLMMPHNPPYYRTFFEQPDYHVHREGVARIYYRTPEMKEYAQALPEKLRLVAERASLRPDLLIRSVNTKDWANEIHLAWQMFHDALKDLPDRIMPAEDEFLDMANSFKAFLDPDLALIAEVGGKPAGFILALPDISEPLKHVNGRLGPLGLIKLWWYSRHLKRVSLKILIVLPEFHYRGVEAVLIDRMGRAIWNNRDYMELDMSLTGDENWKSNRFQDALGFEIYRRYRVYERSL